MRIKETILKELKSADSVVIYGAGITGITICNILKDLGVNVVAFGDDNVSLSGKKLCDASIFQTKEVVKKFPDAEYVIAISSIFRVINALRKVGVTKIHPGGVFLDGIDTSQKATDTYLLDTDLRKLSYCRISHTAFLKQDWLIFPNVSFSITQRCSLKCKECANLMQYFQSPKNYDTDSLFKSLDDFFSVVDEVMTITLIGGDPFMNKEWPAFLEYLINQEKVHEVYVLTNGIIIPNKDDLKKLSHPKVSVAITDYGTNAKNNRVEELSSLFQENHVWYHINHLSGWFPDHGIKKHNRTDEENAKVFADCLHTVCPSILDGRIYRCPYALNFYQLHNPNDEAKDSFDISAKLKVGKDIGDIKADLKEYLSTPQALACCDYCDPFTGTPTNTPGLQTDKPLGYEIG